MTDGPGLTVGVLGQWLERRYPASLAESWDRVGLTVGDPAAPVSRILLTVDVTDEVVAEARDFGAQLIVAHHPLLLRGVHAVRRDDPKGRLVMALIEAGIALHSAHTNADAAAAGVSDALAAAVGLRDLRPLMPAPGEAMDKLVTFVPVATPDGEDHLDRVISSLASAGAGTIGQYDECAFAAVGEGRFRPLPGARPAIGRVGDRERVRETRVEMVLPRRRRTAVLAALLEVHPYETPAFDVYELASLDKPLGLGRRGALAEPASIRELADRLRAALPIGARGVRIAGDPSRAVHTVAVLAGAGDSLLPAVRAGDVDAFVTSDLRHHPAQEFLAHDGAPALVDISHWGAEWLWLPHLGAALADDASAAGVALDVRVSTVCTDPWTAWLPSS